MARDVKELDSRINVNGDEYAVVAERVTGTLTIKAGDTELGTFDGSTDTTIKVPAGGSGGDADSAKKIQVHLDNGTADATITISKNDPPEDDPNDPEDRLGDIWFKYN